VRAVDLRRVARQWIVMASTKTLKLRRMVLALLPGIDERPVNPNRERKSSSSETTFGRDLTVEGEIEAGVLGQADAVWRWCERTGEFGRTAT
jgi:nucleotidyltransferase/DNA polymerase involved in DNA repair